MAVSDLGISDRGSLASRSRLFVNAANGNPAALAGYIARGGNLDAKDEDGMALIHYAACRGDIPLLRKLREHGADLNLLDDGAPPWKPVHYAIFHQQGEAEQVLRTLGAEVPLPILKRIALEKPRAAWSENDARVPSFALR